jgi:hypothetical protein
MASSLGEVLRRRFIVPERRQGLQWAVDAAAARRSFTDPGEDAMRAAKVATVLAALVLAGAARAQTYTIKLKYKGDVGKRVLNTFTNKKVSLAEIIRPDGKVLDRKKENETTEEVYTETVLETGATGPDKFKRTYAKATLPGGKVAPHQGRTVLFNRKFGKCEARAEGEPELPAKDLEQLANRANRDAEYDKDQLFHPGKPVKVGETWSLDKKLLAATFSPRDEVDLVKSTATGTFVRAYKKGGNQHGVLSLKYKLVFKRFGSAAAPATLETEATLDTAIDGSSTAKLMTSTGRIQFQRQLEVGGMKVTLKMDMVSSSKLERSAEK